MPPRRTAAPRAPRSSSSGRGPSTEALRAKIRAEATRLIAAHGYGAIAVNDVAHAVGISKQALLYHYPSKEALRAAVLDHLLDYASRTLPTLVATLIGDDARRTEHALAQIGAVFDAEPHAAAVILRELLDGDAAMIDRVRRGADPWLRLLLDWLRRGQREGRIRDGIDPESAVLVIATLVIATFAMLPLGGWGAKAGGSGRSWRERRLRETVRTIERMLFVDAPPAPRSRARTKRRS